MGLSPLSQPDSPVLAANVFFSSRVDDPACATLLGPDAFLCMTEEQLRSLPVDVETLWIRSRIAVSAPTLEFPHMSRLKKLLLGQETLKRLRSLVVRDLESLESLYTNDFVCCGDDPYGKERRDDGLLVVQRCPKLQVIDFGDFTCAEFRQLSLADLPALECLHLGCHCFIYGRELLLTGRAAARVLRRSAETPPRDGEGGVAAVRPARRSAE